MALTDGIGGRTGTDPGRCIQWTSLRELLALRRMDVDLVDATIRIHRNMGQLTGGRLVVGSLKSSAVVAVA